MIEIIESETFRRWMAKLRDHRAQALIAAHLFRLARGMRGDTAPVGDGVHELRVHFGPGYRIYFLPEGETIIVLLCGGDKSSQRHDIRRAHQLAWQWRHRND